MTRFYAIDAANVRIEELRPLLEGLRADRDALAEAQQELARFRQSNGSDDHARELAQRDDAIRETVGRMKRSVTRIDGWDISLRDIGSGLVDFPALVSGRQVWLCWRLGEGEIAWWHEMSEGFAGRRPLTDLE